MTQQCVRGCSRLVHAVALAAVLTGGRSAPLGAQQGTAQIQGRVRDSTGKALRNVSIFVVGTAFSAMSNDSGYYAIVHVPAGVVTLRAALPGFKAVEVSGLRLTAGQTVTQDFRLEIAKGNLLLPRDERTAQEVTTGQLVDKLPVDRLKAAFGYKDAVRIVEKVPAQR